MTQDKKSLLAHARHELRTPINALLGYSEMLLEDELPDETLRARLQEIPLLSRQILDTILQYLGDDKLQDDLPALGARARIPLEPLGRDVLRSCEDAETLARQNRLDAFLPDIEKLVTAGRKFIAFLESELKFSPGTSAPAASPARSDRIHAVEPALDPINRVTTSASEIEDFTGFHGHVLVVDDNATNRDLLARGLVKEKHHFALAANGAQALDMLQSRSFDVVLLDILMPEMDGYEVLRRIKADPQLQHVPVIMISALDQIDSVVRCIEEGAEDFLPKPFNPLLLKARVGTCLEKKRLRDLELEYLRQVALLTDSAAAVEAGSFDADKLGDVANREDALGNLARVFQRMAREVKAREVRLQVQVQQLKVEIDEARKAKQVAEITETDYFQDLQKRAQVLKGRKGK